MAREVPARRLLIALSSLAADKFVRSPLEPHPRLVLVQAVAT